MSETFSHDVFLSHSAKDKAAVRDLARRLKDDGLRVWFDEWEIKPGDMIGLKIRDGLEHSRTLVLVMSANGMGSEWVTFEYQTVLFNDPTNQQRRFIPLRLDNSELSPTLKQFAHIDWRKPSPDQYAALLSACHPQEPVTEQKESPQLSKVLKGDSDTVNSVAVTGDGRLIVSGSRDGIVRVWEVETGKCIATLKGHQGAVLGVSITADGRRVVSSSIERVVRVWDLDSGKCVAILKGHTQAVNTVAITADGRRTVSGSSDKTVRVWDLESMKCTAVLAEHRDTVSSVAVTPNGSYAISGSYDRSVRVWDLNSGACLALLEGHSDWIAGVSITADGKKGVSVSWDKTILYWDLDSGRCLATFEGHTRPIRGVSITAEGGRIVTCSSDFSIRLWDVRTGNCLITLRGHKLTTNSVAITANGRLAVSGSSDATVRVWELPAYVEETPEKTEAEKYTNAKVLLVGDSGVGKTGLAQRLTENKFEATVSTDGAWATQLKLPHEVSTSDVEREIWLWDFAGQSDYRLIHQLFMDETALAVLVFNPQSENPFEGLGQWDRDLQRAARRKFRKLLVAGRCDRGGLMVSGANVERFVRERSFDKYLETSAYTGDGCDALREAIIANIPWDEIPWTASPRIFKLLKEEIVRLKDEGRVLLRMGELKQQMEMRLLGESFTVEQLRAVVGLLAGPGVVWQLEFGDFVLLQPERINSYAAAVIRSVRAHTDEIGCISEERVLAGALDYQKTDNQRMERLPADEEQIVLRAMHQILVDHGICLREHTEAGTLLVFPSYFKRERPDQPDHPTALVTYRFSGMLDEIYATLVVKLRHTAAFNTDERWLWRFAADFKTQAGKRVGFLMTKKGEGAAELKVYCEPDTAEDTKVTFIRYIHDHLKSKDPEVVRLRHYVCQNAKCGEPIESERAVRRALELGRKKIPCQYCGKQIVLQDLIEQKFASEKIRREVRELEETARSSIDIESRQLILLGHSMAIAAEAGQTFRQLDSREHGYDGEIEFKDANGNPSGRRVYLLFRPGRAYTHTRMGDGREVFVVRDRTLAERWGAQRDPVMLVARTHEGQIRWMNLTQYFGVAMPGTTYVDFSGEPFTALSVARLRDRLLEEPALPTA